MKHAKTRLMLLWLVGMLVLSVSSFTGCMRKPATVVIPDSRVLVALPDRPGYYAISGGYLREVMQQLEVCGMPAPPS